MRDGKGIITWRAIANWLWILGLVILPITVDPLRLEAFETPRATLAVVIAVGLLFSAVMVVWKSRQTIPRSLLTHPIVIAIFVWTISVVLSAVFSLSPSRSILGDLTRRMGALTQISIIAAFVGGGLLARRLRAHSWQLLALTGCIVSLYGLYQALSSIYRPSSTFGVSTFAAGWVIMVILLLLVVIFAARSAGAVLLPTSGLFLSLALLIVFLTITISRGALLGLAAGLGTLGFVWLWGHHRRLAAWFLLVCGILTVMIGIGIYRGIRSTAIVDDNSPLLQRLTLRDRSTWTRFVIWQTASKIAVEWPALKTFDGQTDPYASVRPLVGYGQEMFRFVLEPYLTPDFTSIYLPGQTLDRAHNLWLDTVLTQGLFGLISLLALYVSIGWTCLRVIRREGNSWDVRGWFAAGTLAILVAHVIELQFIFPSLPSEWLWFAMAGILVNTLQPAEATSNVKYAPTVLFQEKWVVPLVGWVLAWPLTVWIRMMQPTTNSPVVAVGLLVVGALVIVRDRLSLLLLVLASALSILIHGTVSHWQVTATLTSDDVRVSTLLLADHAIVLIGLALIMSTGGLFRRLRQLSPTMRLTFALALVIACIWWICDASADTMFILGNSRPDAEARAAFFMRGLQLKTPDDRLLRLAAQNELGEASSLASDAEMTKVASACELVERSQHLNPFELDLEGLTAPCDPAHSS